MADLAIVIPTHRRPGALARCLAHVAAQTALERVAAVVVVQDGADPETDRVLDACGLGVPLVRLVQPRSRGPAAARNVGVDHAPAPVTLLLDDDVLLAPDAVAALIAAGLPVDETAPSLRGHVAAHSEEPASPFGRWREHEGAPLAGGGLLPSGDMGWRFCDASLLAGNTALLQRVRFDERFGSARYEDLELGWRLERAHGHRIRFAGAAQGWHLDRSSLVDWLARMPAFAEAACHFARTAVEPVVADAIGVTAAREVDRFVWRDLELAATLIGVLEPTVRIPPRATPVYGQLWEWECLVTAYRMVQRFFFLGAVRAVLGLPAAVAVDAGLGANEAQVLLLERFARRARERQGEGPVRRSPEQRA